MTTILAFDPGGTTGWCRLCPELKELELGEFPAWEQVESTITQFAPDVIVIETFALYPWARSQMTWNTFVPVEVIGVTKFIAGKRSIPVVMQTAAQGKSFVLPTPCSLSKHKRDAACHAAVYLRRCKLLTRELREWLQQELSDRTCKR